MLQSQTACYCGCITSPEVFLSVNHNRIRQRGGKAYLKNGTEFELEFNNPTSHVQKAVITINGKKQSHGLVLKPGEHFYLDRFMDDKRKLLFDVYEVDDNEVVEKIIENNGNIKVEFYREMQTYTSWTTTQTFFPTIPYVYDTGIKYMGNVSGGAQSNNFAGQSRSVRTKGIVGDSFSAGNAGNSTAYLSSNVNTVTAMNASQNMKSLRAEEQTIETGRVEQGSSSDQDFKTVFYNFEYYPNQTIEFKILPISQQQEEVVFTRSIRDYCSKCGRRAKKGWNVCPGCGQDLRSR